MLDHVHLFQIDARFHIQNIFIYRREMKTHLNSSSNTDPPLSLHTASTGLSVNCKNMQIIITVFSSFI